MAEIRTYESMIEEIAKESEGRKVTFRDGTSARDTIYNDLDGSHCLVSADFLPSLLNENSDFTSLYIKVYNEKIFGIIQGKLKQYEDKFSNPNLNVDICTDF